MSKQRPSIPHQSSWAITPASPLESSSPQTIFAGPPQPKPALPHLVSILRRRWFYLPLCLLLSWVAVWSYIRHQVPIYASKTTLLIKPALMIDQSDIINDQGAQGRSEPVPIITQLAILEHPSMRNAVIERLRLSRITADYLSIQAKQSGETNMVNVTVEDSSPQVAQDAANTVSHLYLEKTRASNQSSIANARRYLERKLKEKETALDTKQRELENAKTLYSSPDVATLMQQTTTSLGVVSASLQDTQVQRQVAQERVQLLRQRLTQTEQAFLSTLPSQPNPLLDSLRSQLASLEIERVNRLKIYKPGEPEIRKIDEEIQSMRDQYSRSLQESINSEHALSQQTVRRDLFVKIAEAQADLASLTTRERALKGATADLKRKVNELPHKERIITKLTQEVALLSASYDQLNGKYQELGIQEETKSANGELIEPAGLPHIPIRPQNVQLYLSGTLAGLILSCLLIFLLESLDGTLRDPQSIEDVLGIPVLSGLPKVRPSRLKALSNGTSGTSAKDQYQSYVLEEGARLLQASITFQKTTGKPIQSLLVTSSLPGEGKTSITLQLGKALANSGRRVILVDGDYRRPGLTSQFQASKQAGLTEVLLGEQNLEAVLVPTDSPNLFVLPTGAAPQNPLSLLQSKQLKSLLEHLKEVNDFIILDAPPLIVTDGLFLSSYADGVLLVVVPGQTPRAAIDRSVKVLQRVQANLVGVCLNKISRGNGYETFYGYDHYQYFNKYT